MTWRDIVLGLCMLGMFASGMWLNHTNRKQRKLIASMDATVRRLLWERDDHRDKRHAAEHECSVLIARNRELSARVRPGHRGPKPAGYEWASWSTIDGIAASCSTPASRAGLSCACRDGDEQQRRLCKDKPMCNGLVGVTSAEEPPPAKDDAQ